MTLYVGVDPGKHHCGIAIFDEVQLITASLQERGIGCVDFVDDEVIRGWLHVAVERMVIRPRSRQKGAQKDLIDVSLAAGEFVGGLTERFSQESINVEIEYIVPSQWKGQRPKEIHWREFVKPKLTREEFEAINWPSQQTLRHNVKDAIGIALYHRKVIRVRQT